jgi:hypothetical protein
MTVSSWSDELMMHAMNLIHNQINYKLDGKGFTPARCRATGGQKYCTRVSVVQSISQWRKTKTWDQVRVKSGKEENDNCWNKRAAANLLKVV